MKRKFIKIIIVIIAVLVLICVASFLIITFREKSEIKKQESEISGWSEYYRKIAEEKCKKESYYSDCCMVGLRRMAENSYLLADEDENCLDGFRSEMLLCIDTLVWCEPIKK